MDLVSLTEFESLRGVALADIGGDFSEHLWPVVFPGDSGDDFGHPQMACGRSVVVFGEDSSTLQFQYVQLPWVYQFVLPQPGAIIETVTLFSPILGLEVREKIGAGRYLQQFCVVPLASGGAVNGGHFGGMDTFVCRDKASAGSGHPFGTPPQSRMTVRTLPTGRGYHEHSVASVTTSTTDGPPQQ